jgi:phosphoenolpyruvate carboxylase
LLGRVLVEQVGESLLGVVEELRRIFIQHREQPRPHTASPDFQDPLLNQARNLISRLSIDEAHRVTKAFAIYFELTNLAETNHRKRRRRAAKLHPEQPPLEGSFRGTFRRMRAAGIDASQALEVLRKIKVMPVFTAHPTEVARRTVLAQAPPHRQTTGTTGPPASDRGRCQPVRGANLREVTSLWQTDEVRLEKPLVTDEIRMGLDHYPFSLFAALPRLYDEVVDSLRAVYEIDLSYSEVPDLLFFGSWIGGDRDGNPFVTPGSTREALQRARNVIIGHYITELERATDQLSASIRQANVSDAVRARLTAYSTQMGDEYARHSRISSSELYRRLLSLIVVRLRHSREGVEPAKSYPSAKEFENDLLLIRESLAANHGLRLGRAGY